MSTCLNAENGPRKNPVCSGSSYRVKVIEEFVPIWKKRNWQTAAKKPVKNVDLWQQLDASMQQHQINWQWVKGHSGHRENELADQLANRGTDEVLNDRRHRDASQ